MWHITDEEELEKIKKRLGTGPEDREDKEDSTDRLEVWSR